LHLDLTPENFSPSLLKKIVYAGGNNPSYAQARDDLEQLAELVISVKDIQKFTNRVGRELNAIEAERVEQFNQTADVPQSSEHTPKTAVVEVDAGRAQLRQEHAGRGVHGPTWSAPRYAALRSLSSEIHPSDPHPDVPKAFLDEKHVKALSGEVVSARARTPQSAKDQQPSTTASESTATNKKQTSARPKLLMQTCVAGATSADAFGPMVAAEATARKFYDAPAKAFLGDGEKSNWTIQQDYFFEFTPILDFTHCVGHLFAAASATGKKRSQAWQLYVQLVTAAWQGDPQKVVALLEREGNAVGPPPEDPAPTDPRKIIADNVGYFRNNTSRMDYATYRKAGLPICSCHIESLIKQFNIRVKGTDKFWIHPCLDNVLKVRAAWLSQDSRWDTFWEQRSDRVARGTRHYSGAAA